MKRKIFIIYDDRTKPNQEIADINGGRSFGDTIYKRRTFYEIMCEAVCMDEEETFRLKTGEGKGEHSQKALREHLLSMPCETAILHLYSDRVPGDPAEVSILLGKLGYVKECYEIGEKRDGVICPDVASYLKLLEETSLMRTADLGNVSCGVMETKAFASVAEREEFLDYITSGFDARFFNSLEGDKYTVTKKSTKIDKIKREFNFYYLLDDSMKHWFVQPYDYKEAEGCASYTMERYHMSDIAIRYVHGAVDDKEMGVILNTLFRFLDSREIMPVSPEVYFQTCDRLYLQKVDERIAQLKGMPHFDELEKQIACGTSFSGIDEVAAYYKKVYERVVKGRKLFRDKACVLAVGHGDLCFSNILFQKDAKLLRLIDPKGALTREELFTDPCYDVAKLSHSICGKYDFFNSDQYEISLDRSLKLCLNVEGDNESAVDLFKKYLAESGYDYSRVRVLEASLFLSMLPLHMDYPKKVLGFVLNAIEILNDVDSARM